MQTVRTRGVVAVLLTTALAGGLAPAAPASALPSRPGADRQGEPVGGPLLGHEGVVARPGRQVPEPPEVDAAAYVVADLDSGEVLAAKSPHVPRRPASTLKILTAITLLPHLKPDDEVTCDRDDVAVEGSKVGVVAGTDYRAEDLFEGMLLPSGNDAARCLANAVGGTSRALELMNAKAKRLRAYDTVARTVNGLDRPDQQASAYDLALLARAGLRIPDFRDYVATERAEFPGPDGSYQIQNHNRLLRTYEGAIGVKTGYTSKAKATYVGAAERGGHTIIVTLLHCKPARDFATARKLLDWGFIAAGDAEPVGTLVEPRSRHPSPTAAPQPVAAATEPAVAQPGSREAGWSFWPVPALPIALGVVIVVGALVYARRKRRSRPIGRRRRRL